MMHRIEGFERPMWETERYRLVDIFGATTAPVLRLGERLLSMAAHPMGAVYLIEKAPEATPAVVTPAVTAPKPRRKRRRVRR